MLEHYYLRRPTQDDIQSVLDLMLRCDQRDVGFPDSDLVELQNDWGSIDLAQDAWLAIGKDKTLQGYCAVHPWSTGFRFTAYDTPGAEDTDLFLSLTVLCEGRARSLLRESNDPAKSSVVTHISDKVEHQKKILVDAGYAINKYIFNLHRDLNGDIPSPDWPGGITLRNVKPGLDDHALHAFIQDAFDKPESLRQSFEEWKEFMMSPVIFLPHRWFLLEDKGDLIGCALCFEYPDHGGMGWVRQLAVRNDHRGKGFGRSLLHHAFRVFKESGFPKVGLATESDNDTAIGLYTSAGMQVTIKLDEFSKEID